MDATSLAAVHRMHVAAGPVAGAAQLTVQTDGPRRRDEARAVAEVLPRRRRHGDRRRGCRRGRGTTGRHAARCFRDWRPSARRSSKTCRDAQRPARHVRRDRADRARVRPRHPRVAHAGDGTCTQTSCSRGPRCRRSCGRRPRNSSARHWRWAAPSPECNGIGVLKRRWLADELGDDQWALQRDIARVFDPLGILNGQGLHPLSGRCVAARPRRATDVIRP